MLPNGWILCKIKDIQTVEVQNGFSPLCVEEPTDRKSLSLGALTGDSLDLNQQKSISVKAVMPSHSLLRKNDILVSRSNTKDKVGRAGLVQSDVEKIYYPDLMMRFQVDAKKADCRFVTLCLQSPAGRRYFECSAAGTSLSMVKINKNILESFPIMLPPLSEQKKIAETLSVWDKAIEKTEKLIEAKILSMQRALIDFFNDHLDNVVNLGDLFGGEIIIEKGRTLLKKQTNGGGIPIVAAGQSYSGYHNEYTHNIPTITVSSSGAYAGFVWYHSEPIWASDCSVLHTKKINLKYLFYFLKKEQEKIYKMQSGGAQPHIYAKDLKQLLFPIIDNRDQNNMVSLFDLLDEEISILKRQLDNYKKQKQGLMQKLLSGQWRVK